VSANLNGNGKTVKGKRKYALVRQSHFSRP